VAGVFAVLLSLAFHVGLVRVIPPIPVGRTPDVRSVKRMRSVELQNVQRLPPKTVARPEPFRPSNPEQFVETPADPASLAEAPAPVEPVTPDTGPMAGAETALMEPPEAEESPHWEPRQELLAIREELLPDNLAILPRRYVDDTPRENEVPDITSPAEWAEGLGRRPVAQRPPPSPEQYAMTTAPGPGLDALAPSDGLVVPGGAPLTERLGLLDEVLEDVTPVKPVEERLELDLLSYEPPDEPDAIYFAIHIRRKGADLLPVVPKDVVLVQDCSESMTPAKLEQCKRGLHQWMDALGEEDRFELIRFRNEVDSCFGGWTNLTPATRARANWFVHNMRARGKTDVYASLRGALSMPREPGRPVLAILVTDGRPTMGLTDSAEIIESFTQANGASLSVFAFGGGSRVNRYLLDYLSYKNRGDALVVESRRDIPDGLRRWAVELSSPVLTDLEYRFAGLSEAEVYPRTLTHLYLDRPLVLYGRAKKPLPKVAFQIVGGSGASRYDMVFTLPWEQAGAAGPDLRSQWAWQRAYHLVGEHIRTGEPSVLEEVQALERQYGLAVPYRRR
jgi:uncharacterized protein YegL